MITAIPTVNPSTTGQGMNATYRPSRSAAATRTRAPGDHPDGEHGVGAVAGDQRHQDHRHGARRPRHLDLRPPNTAATSPATMAVTSPDHAPNPAVIPKARASGSATTATVAPATRSPFQLDERPR